MYKNKTKYFYKAFGLNIVSDIYLPELIAWRGEKIDINIVLGGVPSEIENALINKENLKISKNEMLFCAEGVGKYYIPDDNTIIISPDDHYKYNSLKLYLLGFMFSTLLLKRGIIPIHGSSMLVDGKCIVVTGDSGTGKSTLSSALRKIGHRFLADDIAAIKISEDGIPFVLPAYPQQKLWSDSAARMGYDTRNLFRVKDNEDRYTISAKKEFINLPVPLSAIFELNLGEEKAVEMEQIFGMEKIKVLVSNIYMVEILKSYGIDTNYFKKCLNIAKDTAFFRMTRPKNMFSLDDQIKLVIEKVGCLA